MSVCLLGDSTIIALEALDSDEVSFGRFEEQFSGQIKRGMLELESATSIASRATLAWLENSDLNNEEQSHLELKEALKDDDWLLLKDEVLKGEAILKGERIERSLQGPIVFFYCSLFHSGLQIKSTNLVSKDQTEMLLSESWPSCVRRINYSVPDIRLELKQSNSFVLVRQTGYKWCSIHVIQVREANTQERFHVFSITDVQKSTHFVHNDKWRIFPEKD